MFPGLHFWWETLPFSAAGPSQGSPPFSRVQTESNSSHHSFKLERMGMCKGGENPRGPGGSPCPRVVGKGEGQHAHPPRVLLAGPCLLLLEAP